MSRKQILLGVDVLKKIKSGIQKYTNAVKVTLGPNGRTVILHRGLGSPHVTKDGVTVAKEVDSEDSVESMAIKLARQSSEETGDKAGDGTTTSSVLIGSLINYSYDKLVKVDYLKSLLNFRTKFKFSKVNPNEFKKGMELAKEDLVEGLKDLSTKIETSEQLKDVASVSSNGDDSISNLIYEAYSKLNLDAKIIRSSERSITGKDSIDISKGYTINKGYSSPSFCNTSGNTICELENPIFGIFSGNLVDLNKVIPFLETSNLTKRPLVIISENFDDRVLEMLVANSLSPSSPKVLALRSPGMAFKAEELVDLKVALDYTQDSSKPIKNEDSLGSCLKIRSSKFETVITFEEDKDYSLINSRVGDLKDTLSNSSIPYEIKNLESRIGNLLGKVATINIFSNTDGEFLERLDRLDDALEATKSSIEEGFLPGGGVTLLKLSKLLESNLKSLTREGSSNDCLKGYKTVLEAIREPFKCLVGNSGLDYKKCLKSLDLDSSKLYKYSSKEIKDIEILKDLINSTCINLSTGKVTNFNTYGVIDPTKVTRLAVENSISAASTLITTGCTISIQNN